MSTMQFSSTEATRQSFAVYIAGQFCPVISVTCSSGVWTIPSITLELAPDRTLIRLGKGDKIPVQVFYLDTYYFASQNLPPTFCLLAEGEISGWSYTDTPQGRTVTFACSDYFSIFQQLFPYLMTNAHDLLQANVEPSAPYTFAPISELTFPAALFYQGLDNSSGQFIKRPFDFISNLVNAICGTTSYAQYKSAVTANFFSRWIRKNNFLNRLAPSPILESDLSQYAAGTFPILQVVQQEKAMAQVIPALSQQGDRIANSSNMWELLQSIFSKVYYEIGLNPAPACVTTDLSGNIQGPPLFANGGGESAGSGPATATQPVRLLNYVTKPALQFCVPPSCNVLYPSMIKSFAFSENYIAQPTRAYMNDETRAAILSQANSSSQLYDSLVSTMVGSPARAQQEIAVLQSQPARSGKNFLIWPDEYFIGPIVYRSAVPSWFMYMANSVSTNKQPNNSNILYQLYADYELQRMRCEAKNGAVVTVFDPYVIAAHPGVVFDNTAVGNHVFAYFTTVEHRLSVNEFSTQIGFNYAQTFSDFFDQYAADVGNLSNFSASGTTTQTIATLQASLTEAEGTLVTAQAQLATDQAAGADQSTITADQNNIALAEKNIAPIQSTLQVLLGFQDVQLDSSPASPIPIIRTQFQNISNAQDYYNDLLFQGQQPKNKPSVFSWRNALGIFNEDDPNNPDDIYFEVATTPGTTVQGTTTPADGTPAALPPPQVNSVVTSNATSQDGQPDFQLKPLYAQLAAQSGAALIAGSRPICTMEQYIDFSGDRGVRIGPIAANGPHSLGGLYYEQILAYSVAPATAPVETPAGSGNIAAPVTADIAQDWGDAIKSYRAKIWGLIPQVS
jgi:hypothetical protein